MLRFAFLLQNKSCLAGKQVGDEDLEEMIESGNPGVFTQGIITDTQQVCPKYTLFLCVFSRLLEYRYLNWYNFKKRSLLRSAIRGITYNDNYARI